MKLIICPQKPVYISFIFLLQCNVQDVSCIYCDRSQNYILNK